MEQVQNVDPKKDMDNESSYRPTPEPDASQQTHTNEGDYNMDVEECPSLMSEDTTKKQAEAKKQGAQILKQFSRALSIGEKSVHGGYSKDTGGATGFGDLAAEFMSPAYKFQEHSKAQNYILDNPNPM